MWEYQIIYWVKLQTMFCMVYAVSKTRSYYCRVLASCSFSVLFLGFRSAPLFHIQWLINPQCLYLPRPHTDLQRNVQCSVTCLRTFLKRQFSEALLRLNGQQFDSIQSETIPGLTFISKVFTLAENDALFKTRLKLRCTQMLQPL